MVLRENCIWANTVVAPTIRAPKPSRVGSSPDSSMRDWATAASMAAAASWPMVPCSWATIWPWAASSPSTRPITVTAMITVGARENSV